MIAQASHPLPASFREVSCKPETPAQVLHRICTGEITLRKCIPAAGFSALHRMHRLLSIYFERVRYSGLGIDGENMLRGNWRVTCAPCAHAPHSHSCGQRNTAVARSRRTSSRSHGCWRLNLRSPYRANLLLPHLSLIVEVKTSTCHVPRWIRA